MRFGGVFFFVCLGASHMVFYEGMKQEKTSVKLKISFVILLIVFIALVALFGDDLSSLVRQQLALQPYIEKVNECVDERMAYFTDGGIADGGIDGERYGCAHDIAGGIYGGDPELAIALCARYHLDRKTKSKGVIEATCDGTLLDIAYPPDSPYPQR